MRSLSCPGNCCCARVSLTLFAAMAAKLPSDSCSSEKKKKKKKKKKLHILKKKKKTSEQDREKEGYRPWTMHTKQKKKNKKKTK
eukprot:NODE_26156_length_562_cov_1.618391.p2 GENE.NODE_26156_length_562_cov_1.618391~~NODE_26156_length_562_cov_1.618391.p2  ORF type:complete len:84 (+),score=34.77 NODE_26156_length_562_cov_1.618391:271-522(+)